MSTITPIFDSNRLLIRPVNLIKDLVYLSEYLNDAKTMQWIPNKKKLYGTLEIKNRFEINTKAYQQGIGIYLIIEKKSNKIMGEVGLFPFKTNLNSIEIGYILHHKYWKQGYATELLLALEDYITSLNKYTIIVAQLYAQNTASAKLLLRCNFIFSEEQRIAYGVYKQVYLKNIAHNLM